VVVSKLGRNDPCHCGSGKKYKKCHEPLEEAREREERSLRTLSQWVDFHSRTLVETGRALAAGRPEIAAAASRFFEGAEAPADPLADETFVQHALFDLPVEAGAPLVTAAQVQNADADDQKRYAVLRQVLSATHPSLYEVVDCRRGRHVKLADRLTGAEYTIADAALADGLDPMEVVAGRVVRLKEGNVLLAGWSKVRFRGRKAAIRAVRDAMAAADLPEDEPEARVAWLRREAATLYRLARAAAPAAAPATEEVATA
jgi:methyl coenzyme M reductase gamma subunit